VDLLATPLMQHYLTLYRNIVARDTKIPAQVKTGIEKSVECANEAVRAASTVDPDAAVPGYEGPVQKETDGVWKDRYLILTDTELVMTLTAGKEAAPGTERSKRMPLSSLTNIVPNQRLDAPGRYVFAIQINGGSNIVLGVATQKERDVWLAKLMRATGLDN
jgi:hypothetical protein